MRTHEEFMEIIESAINGNWKQSAQEAVDYGFYAKDLIDHLDEEIMASGKMLYFDAFDIAIIVELATELRCKMGLI